MKKIIFLALCAVFVVALTACSGNGDSVVGKWIDDETEAMYEYTQDGYYYEYVNETYTTDKTRYSVGGGKITYYIDGERKESGFSVDYEIDDEGRLIINGEIVYRPLVLPDGE